MKALGKNTLLLLITFLLVVSYSCESNFKEVQRINSVVFSPSGEADNVDLKYTDSGKIKAVLLSPKMLDYSNAKYPFTEFPKGIHVTLYDDNRKMSFVDADYAVTYSKTDIIDLQGNVKITSSDGKLLQTEQMYYDLKNEWFITEKHFKYTDEAGGYLEGPGVDFSKDFKVFNMQKSRGEVTKLE
jgi:LPS export ABC transporter protein LptC